MDNFTNMAKKESRKCSILKKSVSTASLSIINESYVLREAKSFTGNTDDLKNPNDLNHEVMHNKRQSCGTQIEEQGLQTREVNSNQVFLVKDDMLSYQGKRYTVKDIATEWKKDCRMWLWKGKKNKSMNNIRRKLQTLKI